MRLSEWIYAIFVFGLSAIITYIIMTHSNLNGNLSCGLFGRIGLGIILYIILVFVIDIILSSGN